MPATAPKDWPPYSKLAILLLPLAYLVGCFVAAGIDTVPVFSYAGWHISARGAWLSGSDAVRLVSC